MGRLHPQLVRFARALSATGTAVLVPEVPEWRALNVTPRVTAPTIRGAADLLDRRADVSEEKYGLIGFSFGAPQVAIAAADERLQGRVAGAVLFGGYCSLERTLVFQMTGRHEWDGVDYASSPDPYGRWVVGSNHLTDVPGYEDAGDVAEALHLLAAAASDRRVKAWEPYHDPMIEELRASLPGRRQELFDYFARSTRGGRKEGADGAFLASGLALACQRVEPLLEPMDALAHVSMPMRLIHGRGDRLIPFTEGLRLGDGLPAQALQDLTVTGLIDHSADCVPATWAGRMLEGASFFGAIRGLINLV